LYPVIFFASLLHDVICWSLHNRKIYLFGNNCLLVSDNRRYITLHTLTRVSTHIVKDFIDVSIGAIFVGTRMIASGGEFKTLGVIDEGRIKRYVGMMTANVILGEQVVKVNRDGREIDVSDAWWVHDRCGLDREVNGNSGCPQAIEFGYRIGIYAAPSISLMESALNMVAP
jgi:hypothetical protein